MPELEEKIAELKKQMDKCPHPDEEYLWLFLQHEEAKEQLLQEGHQL